MPVFKSSSFNQALVSFLTFALIFSQCPLALGEGGCEPPSPNAVSTGTYGSQVQVDELYVTRDENASDVCITLDGSLSTPGPDPPIWKYTWWFRDGDSYTETDENAPDENFDGICTHDYAISAVRTYNVMLKVWDQKHGGVDEHPKIYIAPTLELDNPYNITIDAMDLSWESDVSPQEWGTNGKYEVYKSTTPGFALDESAKIGTITSHSQSVQDYHVTSLTPSTDYYFKVKLTTNDQETKRKSDEKSAGTYVDPVSRNSIAVGGGSTLSVTRVRNATVTFLNHFGTYSRDPDDPGHPTNGIEQYVWYFGDGDSYTNSSPSGTLISCSHLYDTADTYYVTLVVTDDDEATAINTDVKVIAIPWFNSSLWHDPGVYFVDLWWETDVQADEWKDESRYEVYLNSSKIHSITQYDKQEYTVTGLAADTTYLFQVRLVLNDEGCICGPNAEYIETHKAMTEFSYDDAGNLAMIYAADSDLTTESEITLEYDTDTGRITQITYPDGLGTASYAYNKSGQCLTVTYPDSTTVEYAYDDNGRLTQVTRGNDDVYYHYDSVGNCTFINFDDFGPKVYCTYDHLNRLSIVENENSSAETISEYTYHLDKMGNCMTKVYYDGTDNITTVYGYDNLYRLTSEVHDENGVNPYSISFEYDEVGNRLSMVEDDGTTVTTTYTYNNLHQLITSVASGTPAVTTTYQYDAFGNLTYKSDGTNATTYEWNYLEQLVKADLPGNPVVTYDYDGRGNRIQRTYVNGATTQIADYLVDYTVPISRVLMEKVGATTAVYVYGNDLLNLLRKNGGGTNVYAYLHDGLGSVVNLVDSNESVQNTYQYDAFGNKVTSTTGVTNVYEFTGEEFDDDTDLLYLRARYYDPEVGRFVSRDPLVEQVALGANPGRATLFIYPYVYCDNNPVNWVDPFGLWYIDIGFTLTTIIGPGVMGGVMIGNKGVYVYGGGFVGTTGLSLTWSPYDPIPQEEPTIAIQGGKVIGGQLFDTGTDKPGWEIGLMTPGGGAGYYKLVNVRDFAQAIKDRVLGSKEDGQPTTNCESTYYDIPIHLFGNQRSIIVY